MPPSNAEFPVAEGHGFRRFTAILVTVGWSTLAPICPAGPPTLPTSVDRALRQRVEDGYNQGVVVGLLNRDGRTFHGYGRQSHLTNAVPDEQTLFEIGSITKLFTAALLADAVVRGEVGLDDPVQSLLPGAVRVPRGNQEILLRGSPAGAGS